ncbi:5-bromo-4-chloroindolyl phosphate hydrolysis family protein [Rhodovulum sulfidophilum]|uniref:5-bromo-4-chloroindolyl phosphate hydrolysis family protein n=2 Tax=Rhodovulum sulfidophilum TaxID=35806 RepID=A0ABS1RWY9_RHOSU|nr:5-bromo-4-chloroindolyl phosphate hydrolysis family protein [Rhodovulum sulfidophilum]MBL3609620.1 5-bromo-4-chloroindolyl phosphate hydrolysis family protein [Rhodovulum sulfidophilum]
MAHRFGGRYSPGRPAPAEPAPPRHPFQGRRPARAAGRANAMFFAPLPLVPRAFFSDPAGLALSLSAFGLLMLAAWLTREGLRAEDAWTARKVARRPAVPRKILGSVLTGAGLFLAGIGGEGAAPVIFGALGLVLHSLTFGIDPLSDKGMEGIDSFQNSRVARAVEEAEKHLATMSEAIRHTGERSLVDRVERFQATVREMLRTVEEDPRDLTAARRYLVVYLMGARDATVKFADLYPRSRDASARQDYETLLADLETHFAARTRALMQDDRTDLDVEIEVLRDRLHREGIAPVPVTPKTGETA